MSGTAGTSLPEAQELLNGLNEAAGDSVVAVLLYGSRLVATAPDRHSAWDFVIVVSRYGEFYRRLRQAGRLRRRPWVMSLANRVLPPNAIAFWPAPPDGPLAKCLVLSREHFERALGPRRRDHFVAGRMVQRVAILHARDGDTRDWTDERLAEARRTALDWTLPFLVGPFDVDAFCRRMLEVSYRAEIRPEARDRAGSVYEAQEAFLGETFGPLLEEAVASGRLTRDAAGYRRRDGARGRGRLGWRLYFAVSKARATARWLKHTLTFDEWLNYIVRKVERRTGEVVEITAWERRLPFLLLWPKVFRVLRARPVRSEAKVGSGTSEAGG